MTDQGAIDMPDLVLARDLSPADFFGIIAFELAKHPHTMPEALAGGRQDWNTPQNLLDVVYQMGEVALDPCSNDTSIVRARLAYTEADDGLLLPWGDGSGGIVFVNPPYGRATPAWAAKMALEGAFGREILALLPVRTDTTWWQAHLVQADKICFWRGRLRFLGAPSSASFASAVAYWGPRQARFEEVFGPHGWVVEGQGR